MKSRSLTLLQYLFFLGLGVFFVWLSVKDIRASDWQAIKDAVARSRQWLVVPAFLFLILAHYSRALRWRILMEPLGYQPSRFNVFAAVMIGYLVNAAVPRLGEVMKCSLLARYEKMRVDRLVGTIVIERTVDVLCLGLALVLALVFEGEVIADPISRRLSGLIQNNSGEVSAARIGGLALVLVLLIGVVFLLLRRFAALNFVAAIKQVLVGIGHGLNSIRKMRHKTAFVIHTLLIWLLYLAGTTLGIYAFRETSHLGIGGGLTTLVLGSVGMVLTPGGIGAYPLLVSKLLKWYGLPERTIGVALGWLLWTFQSVVTIAGGLLCFAYLSHHNKKRFHESGTHAQF